MIKIMLIETDKCCYINDCYATEGYDYSYHRSEISDLFFDGELPTKTFAKNWLRISKYPSLIEKEIKDRTENVRWEINDKKFVSTELPETIFYTERNLVTEDVLAALYQYTSDVIPTYREVVDVEIEKVLDVVNFDEPINFEFKAIRKWDYKDQIYDVSNVSIKHQLFDKIIFPEIMLTNRPCSLSSKLVYDITRQYIKENIDLKVAKITSDYDFCFTVVKIVRLIEPETVTYQNIFARTKKERSKIKFAINKFKDVEIFQMTHDQSKYNGYTSIPPIYGKSEADLKKNVDEWLNSIIIQINKPLQLCEHCDGTGYKQE